jgi:succinoglycan biosynthesis transport protein ExoP
MLPASEHPTSAGFIRLPSLSTQQPAGSAQRPKSNIHVIASVRRHWYVFLSVLIVILVCGAYALRKKVKPLYQATSIVYVAPKFPKMLPGDDSELDLPYDSYVQDQIQTVTRYDIIADAIEKLPPSVRHRTGPALPYEIQVLQKTLDVKRMGSTYEVSIALSGSSPGGLAEIVNTVTNTYVKRAKNEEFYGLDDRLKTLNQEKERLQNQIDQRLAEQARLMEQLGVAMIQTGQGATDPYDLTLQRIREELTTAQMQRAAAEAQLNAMLEGDISGKPAVEDSVSDQAIAADPGASTVKSMLTSRRATLIQEMNGLRSDHPIYQKDKNEIASLDNQLRDLRRRAGEQLRGKLLQEVTRTRLVELNLIAELGKSTHQASSAAPKFQRASELGPEIDSLQKAYDEIGDRIRDLELESNSPGSIHVSTAAQTPLGPERSKLPFLGLALILGGLACAAAVPVAIDQLDNRIYTPHDVERVVGFHPLAILLDDYEFSRDLVEEYSFRLAAAIDHAARTSGARTFLFTSITHGGGTSTVVKSLGERLKGLNLRTKIISESELEEEGGLRGKPALPYELLLRQSNPHGGTRASSLSAVSTAAEYSQEESTALETVPEAEAQQKEGWDVVLIDASPLPISAHTEYLARTVDAAVLVVRSSATTRQELERAARLLERLDVSGVAVVLNQMTLGRADSALRCEFRRYQQAMQLRHAMRERASVREAESRAGSRDEIRSVGPVAPARGLFSTLDRG